MNWTQHPSTTATLEPPQAGIPPVTDPPPGRRRRRVWRTLGAVLAVVFLTAAGVAYWALDRFVIEHVEISDVSAYEAEARATGEAAAITTTDDASTDDAGTTDDATSTAATGAAAVTDSSYSSDTMSIDLTTYTVGEGSDAATVYVADVVLDDATALRGGFAENQFGTNITADTSDIAEYYDAIFAINGDYYGFRESGIVIRNGVLFRDDGARTGLAIYTDGHMEVYDETTTTGDELLAAGVWNTISFGPALVDGGAIVGGIEDVEVDTNFGNHSIQGDQPRTGIGMIDENHFVFVVVDGRSDTSAGVTMTEFAQIFVDLGATVAYNLDGGGSATMYFDGEVVNVPQGNGDERPTSDIFYLAAS